MVNTSNGISALQAKIVFNSNDIELGLSDESKAVIEEYEEYIGTEDFPTVDSLVAEVLGRNSYVSDIFANTYDRYPKNGQLGSATIGYEVKDGAGKVAFAYVISNAKTESNKIDNMLVGGVVLKVKTSEKKQTTIRIIESKWSDGLHTSLDFVTNEITLNLNGYGE